MTIQAIGNSLGITGSASTPNQRNPQAAEQTARVRTENQQESASTAKAEKPENQKTVQEATRRLQDFVSNVRGDIQFSMDNDSGKTIVKVVDRSTKEVIRQFPSEEAIELAKALDRFQGLLVKNQA